LCGLQAGTSPDKASREFILLKHHEFWPPRIFEAPFYLFLAYQCALNLVGVRSLAKANYALNHGEIGLGSKYATQQVFDQAKFPATAYLPQTLTLQQCESRILQFADKYGYPLILKPDIGMTGKGLIKIVDESQVSREVSGMTGNYLLQAYCSQPLEFGVFYVRCAGRSMITGINQKHFPFVTGDGVQSVAELALRHPRYTDHWQAFLRDLDTGRIPAADEHVPLSFIGSHTLGCLFTDDSDLLTDELEVGVFDFLDPVAGYNFGRLDVRADSVDAFQGGEFTVIEANGVSSLPTHMFDPEYSLFEAYRIFFKHGRYLVAAAVEQKHQSMDLMSLLDIARNVRICQQQLEQLHQLRARR